MKKILLLVIFFVGISVNSNAYTFEEDNKACDGGEFVGCYNLGIVWDTVVLGLCIIVVRV